MCPVFSVLYCLIHFFKYKFLSWTYVLFKLLWCIRRTNIFHYLKTWTVIFCLKKIITVLKLFFRENVVFFDRESSSFFPTILQISFFLSNFFCTLWYERCLSWPKCGMLVLCPLRTFNTMKLNPISTAKVYLPSINICTSLIFVKC